MATLVEVGEGLGHIDAGVLELLEARSIGTLKRYRKGEVLYWQGAPADCVFVVRTGKVKVYCISPEGKAHTYEILGAGRLVGATACLLGKEYESMAETLEHTDVYIIPLARFENLLVDDLFFSMAVMRELAQVVRSLFFEVRGLCFMDVQQRLKYSLARLADEHGRVTKREHWFVTEQGVKIDLRITHEEIAELIAASRTTITACLNELRKRGYVWKEGRRLVIIPPEHIEILDNLSQSVVKGDEQEATSYARKAVEERVDPIKALDALAGGMRQVDKGFVRRELALPDVLMAAFAMQSAMPIVEDAIKRAGKKVETPGTIVIGTVRGDIHDMGKTMVRAMLVGAGFNVVDIGNDRPLSAFAEAAEKENADIVGLSAVMTATVPVQRDVIEYFEALGIRGKHKIIVGGSACTREYAEEIGADAYGVDAVAAVKVAKGLMGISMEEAVEL